MTTISNGESGASARAKINNSLLREYNVADYGATGDGSTDDLTFIQDAIDAAIAAGGGIIYFPPSNGGSSYYKVTASPDFASDNVPIYLVGVPGIGQHGSKIHGSFSGWVIDHDGVGQTIRGIFGLCIENTHASGKGIRFNDSQTGIIEHCHITATMNGITSDSNSYNLEIRNTTIHGVANATGSVGLQLTQTNATYCSITGWDHGVRTFNTCPTLTGTRIETCNTAIVIGMNAAGSAANSQGGFIKGCQTERCNTSVYFYAAKSIVLAGNTWTGTVGVYRDLTSLTWSGGTATATFSGGHGYGTSGTKTLIIEGAAQSGYNGTFTCTMTSATTFTYAVVADPGASPATPDTGRTTIWFSPLQDYGLRFRDASNVVVIGDQVSITLDAAGYGIACANGDGTGSTGDNNIFIGVSGGSWEMPAQGNTPTAYAHAFEFYNCDNPTAAFTFDNLPQSPVEGMLFSITDGSTATWGATCTGGGVNHVLVRRSDSNWTVVGK